MELEGFAEVVRRAQAGDQAALNKLMAGVRPLLWAVAAKYAPSLGAAQSVSDLVQEAQARAWCGLKQFSGGNTDEETFAKFRAWLCRILRRLGLDALRHANAARRRDPVHGHISLSGDCPSCPKELGGKSKTPCTLIGAKETSQRVRRAIAELPTENMRRIVRLRFFEGKSLRQTAEELSLPYHFVKEKYRAAMKHLEKKLEMLWE